jgi:hypothetical protein
MRNRNLLQWLRSRRHPEFVGDQPMLDWFNRVKAAGLLAPGVTLAQLLSVGQDEHDRQHGIPPGH